MIYIGGIARKTFAISGDRTMVRCTGEEWDRLPERSKEMLISPKGEIIFVANEQMLRSLYKKHI